MKKILIVLATISLLVISIGSTNGENALVEGNVDAVEYVYICTGPYASTYHSHDDCKGLNKCSARVKKVTLEEAEKMGRRPCRICY